ncbi:MAG TPA: hypothetical protein VGB14_03635, partial [Acidimicrobiales bacterium]
MPEPVATPLLHAAVARLCDRLAGLVDATPWASADVATATAALLRDLAADAADAALATAPGDTADAADAAPAAAPGDTAGAASAALGTAPVGAPEPLACLAAGLGATPAECDAVVLAGLADHHEALSATFRLLHPDDDPWPTLGLAAQLATAGPAERAALRRSADAGPLAVCLRPVEDDHPAWERPLRLVAGLWPVLAGEAGAPGASSLGAVRGGPVVAGLDGWLDRPDVVAAARLVAVGAPVAVVVTAADAAAAAERGRALVLSAGRQPLGFRPARLDDPTARAARAHAAAAGAVPVVAVPDGGPAAAVPGPGPAVLGTRRGGPLPAA